MTFPDPAAREPKKRYTTFDAWAHECSGVLRRALLKMGAVPEDGSGAAYMLTALNHLVGVMQISVRDGPLRQLAVRNLENVAALCAIAGLNTPAQVLEMGASEHGFPDEADPFEGL